MAYNDKKIIEVLFKELDGIPERCNGYKLGMKELLADVLYLEREHTISKINVVQKITDKINAAGVFYYNKSNSN